MAIPIVKNIWNKYLIYLNWNNKAYQNPILFSFFDLFISLSIPLLRLAISKDDEGDSLNHEDDDGDDPDIPPLCNVAGIAIDDGACHCWSNKSRDGPDTVGQPDYSSWICWLDS